MECRLPQENWISSDHFKLFTDASGNIGYAAVFGSWWFEIPAPNHYTAIKELYPIVIALELWGKYMVNSKVLFLSDNQAVVDVLNIRLIRRLVLCTLSYNIVFRAQHSV
jgi:hypothetical protein